MGKGDDEGLIFQFFRLPKAIFFLFFRAASSSRLQGTLPPRRD